MREKMTRTMFAALHSAASSIPTYIDPKMPAVKKLVARGLATVGDDMRLAITDLGRQALKDSNHG